MSFQLPPHTYLYFFFPPVLLTSRRYLLQFAAHTQFLYHPITTPAIMADPLDQENMMEQFVAVVGTNSRQVSPLLLSTHMAIEN